MSPHYAHVADRAAHRCEYCRAPEAIFNFPFEVEHILPPGRGGSNDESNLALSCRCCNVFKSDYLEAVDTRTGLTAPLFNPRENRWEDHFAGDPVSGKLIGLTQTGRATIERLRMNGDTQVAARRHWMQLRLFP